MTTEKRYMLLIYPCDLPPLEADGRTAVAGDWWEVDLIAPGMSEGDVITSSATSIGHAVEYGLEVLASCGVEIDEVVVKIAGYHRDMEVPE